MVAIETVTTTGETAALSGVARAPSYRHRQPVRASVLNLSHSERFVDHSPAEVQATLLEEKRFCARRGHVSHPAR